MRTTILIATLLLSNGDLFSQGGVDVKYIGIETVDNSLIGQDVKIDFKSPEGTKVSLMQKARIHDTVTIYIDNRLVNLIERKGTGVDYWYFDKEYLESFDYDPGLILRIKEIKILDIQTDSIYFEMKLEHFRKVKEDLELVSSETKDTRISKDKIEGVLIRKY